MLVSDANFSASLQPRGTCLRRGRADGDWHFRPAEEGLLSAKERLILRRKLVFIFVLAYNDMKMKRS